MSRLSVYPPLSPSPRSSLDKSSYASIDSALKSLKACSRRLRSVLSVHHTELQILERLYYKGKNQHRSALFWKRVAEMRRYANRLDGMRMLDAVESLRCSFFDEAARQNPKLLKGPWTCTPCAAYVCHALERLSACYALVEKARERLIKTYCCFTLAMQSGAFIQLVLALAAIASRMFILMPEIQEALALGWAAGHAFLQALNHSSAIKLRPIGAHANSEGSAIPTTTQSTQSTSKSYEFNDAHHEDLGSSIPRLPKVPSFSQDVNTVSAGSRVPSAEYKENAAIPGGRSLHAKNIVEQPSRPIVSHDIQDPNNLSAKKQERKHRPSDVAPISKKKRDEIDDIFGF